MSKVAALARRVPSWPPPYRVTWRTTSWLDSTQVAGAPTPASAAMPSPLAPPGGPRQSPGDGAPEPAGIPRREQEVEGERGVQLVGSKVQRQPLGTLHPCLGDECPIPWIRVGDPPPATVDVVDLVPIPVRVAFPRRPRDRVISGQVRHLGVLGETVGHVDTEPVDPPFEPEVEDGLELR